MLEIGFPELLVIVFVGLLVVGPEKLPQIIKASTRSFGAIKSYLIQTRSEIEKSVGMDEIRQDLHNEKIMKDLKANKKENDSTE
jgi:sec-independent protein translocase protein TatB